MITQELPDSLLITVCENCKQSSCWQGIFMCQEADVADVVDLPVYKLREIGAEHPDYWNNDVNAESWRRGEDAAFEEDAA